MNTVGANKPINRGEGPKTTNAAKKEKYGTMQKEPLSLSSRGLCEYEDATIKIDLSASTSKDEDDRRKYLEIMRSNHCSSHSGVWNTTPTEKRLSPRSLTFIVINLISAGYILLPYGKNQIRELLVGSF